VHHRDFPPLPLSQGYPPGSDVGAGQSATNNNANTGEGPRSGFDVQTTDYGLTTITDLNDPGRTDLN
jgi:hypothetical protein